MSLLRVTVEDAAIGVAVADAPEQLNAFLKPGCAAAIWRRKPLPEFQDWIDNLDPSSLPHGRVVLRPAATRAVLTQLCETSQTPASQYREQLVDDVVALADRFADLMNAPYLRLRLAVVTSNACRKFHIDAISGRLICTYRGVGTQYGISRNGLNPTRVFTVPTGAPILLRGTLWPEKPASGLLHRSPPIEGTGETRLVLVLDPLSEPEDDV